jgi:hypothetical protein
MMPLNNVFLIFSSFPAAVGDNKTLDGKANITPRSTTLQNRDGRHRKGRMEMDGGAGLSGPAGLFCRAGQTGRNRILSVENVSLHFLLLSQNPDSAAREPGPLQADVRL